MTDQNLGQAGQKVKRGVSAPAGRFDGRVLRRADIDTALRETGISHAERKVVEFLLPLLASGPMQVANRHMLEGAKIFRASLTPALRRAIEHEFLCRDAATRPHTWWIHDKWFAGGSVL